MAIENLVVWPFSPNWQSDLTETLEWKTDILTSPTGAEQRRGLRRYPRRFMDYSLMVTGLERAYLDNYMSSAGASDCFLPLWQDQYRLAYAVSAGATWLPFAEANVGWFDSTNIALIGGDSPFLLDLVEIASVSSGGITLVTGGSPRAWSAGTPVYPVMKARPIDNAQPDLSHRTNEMFAGSIKFLITHPDPSLGTITSTLLPDTYGGFSVLVQSPDEIQSLDFSYTRILEELDNESSVPVRADTADTVMTTQQYRWYLSGRAEHKQFERMLMMMRGRAVPFWCPTFLNDFEPIASIAAGTNTLSVAFCGFTTLGGPRPNRQHIRVLMQNGSRFYRRITASSIGASHEVLTLDSVVSSIIPVDQIAQISFMTLSRLDQDSIDVVHSTDNQGQSSATMVIKSIPEIRTAPSAFG